MNKAIRRSIVLLLILLYNTPHFLIYAQHKQNAVIKGTVSNNNGYKLDYATITLKNTHMNTNSDEFGNFLLEAPSGKYTLIVSYLGYQTYEKNIEIKPQEKLTLHIIMEKNNNNLDEIIFETKSPVQHINESAYNVSSIDTKILRNTSMDVSNVLDKVTGIKIRENGGVGSSTQINLNGFTGQHVKFFMDGVPLDASGDGFPVSALPLGIVERIDVYKGVVPVELGADALGGAINIVTGKSTNTLLDASYSYGSFNTHKSSINFRHTFNNGLAFQLGAFQNYSDNDYKVKVDEYLDVNTGLYKSDSKWFKRFHDRYHNELVMAKIGLVNKTWADRLMLGFQYSNENIQIQNANIQTIVFGGKKQKSDNISPSLEYEKRNVLIQNLNVSVSGRYDRKNINNVDTLAREYSWTGEYRNKTSQGEADKTIGKQTDKSGYITTNINYTINDRHILSLNNMFSDFRRSEKNNGANKPKRESQKDIVGLSYKYVPNKKWNALMFGKYYYTNTKKTEAATITTEASTQTYDYNLQGYGFAATYNPIEIIQLKTSFEKAYRLPTPKELFGDGSLEKGNSEIKPENARNLNFSITLNKTFANMHSITVDAGFIYRHIKDFIKREVDNKGYAGSINLKKVTNIGGEFEARYFYKNKLAIGGNLTFQNMRNKEKVEANDPKASIYNDRIPNVPYFFGNADINYNFINLFGNGNILSVGYNLHYIHKFYKRWQGNGGKINVPSQTSHDVNLTYSLQNGRYNLAFEVRNITDELLYDNFSLQKPGRSFSIKFRYFFFKHSNN